MSVEVNAAVAGAAGGQGGRLRAKTLGVALAVVIVTSAVSFAIGSRIKSPAEIAARTAAPAASLIAVPVEKRTLAADVVQRGTVRYGAPQAIVLPTSAVKKGTRIMSAAPAKGGELKEGSVAFTVSGRPVFVFQGERPAYRDMGPGATGDDVRQLQAALTRLGFYRGAVDGTYNGATAAAVATWYQKAGWAPQGPTDEQLAQLRTLQTDQYAARGDALSARDSLVTAQNALTVAQEKATAARAAFDAATTGVAGAQAKFEADKKVAAADVAGKGAALNRAIDTERAARARADQLAAAQPPAAPADIQAANDAANAASQAVATARADLTTSQAAQAAVVASTDPAKAAAAAKSEIALADAEAARASAAIPIAQDRLNLAGGRSGSLPVGEFAGRLGIQVPADEVLFFASLPLRVDDVKYKVGDEITGQVMTVTNSRLVIDAALSPEDAKLVAKGAPVSIRATDLGITVNGSVSDVATKAGTNGVDATKFYVEVTPVDAPASLVGASVVLTISVGSTQGEVLAVPNTALSVAADGTSRVQVMAPDKSTHYVTVTPGLSARNYVAVTPVGGSLAPGDLVVTGDRAPTRAVVPAATTGGPNSTTTSGGK